jgi:hypothetical protein
MRRIFGLIIMLLAVSVLSFGQFSVAHNVSNSPGIRSSFTQVAFGPDGILHIVWDEDQGALGSAIYYSSWDGTTLSTPVAISDSGVENCYFPFIAVNNKGMMAVIWAQKKTHHVAVFDPDTKEWLEPEEIADLSYGGGEERRPKIALDENGNIYAFFFSAYSFSGYARCKIEGVWEGIFQLNPPGVPSKEGGICVGPDGWAWVVYSYKESDGDYKVAYRKRTKDTAWTDHKIIPAGSGSFGKPFVNVGLDSVPYVSIQHLEGNEGSNVIVVVRLDETEYHRETVNSEPTAYHYPRVAIDNEGYQWVASQHGQGDQGLGIRFFDNTSGAWVGHGYLPNSSGWPKLPGIAADAYGNVAISFESITDGYGEAYFCTRYPVEPKHFYPPANTKATVSVTGIMSAAPQIKYGLSWEKNPDNNDTFIGGYKIYKKLGSGDWEFLTEVTKDTLSYEMTFTTALTQKIQFAISTVSVAGFEGDKKAF